MNDRVETTAATDIETHSVMGVPIQVVSFSEAVQLCAQVVSAQPKLAPQILAHVNPHSLIVARNNPEFHAALCASHIRLADGAGILLAGRMMGNPFPDRITGPDLFPAVSDELADRGARFFFYGSTPEVLEDIETRMQTQWPGIEVCGTLSPPFRTLTDEEEVAHCRQINATRPDVLWVGMTAPKQELWAHRNCERLDVPLVGCIGAAFDYVAGAKTRSPKWFRDRGMEWLPRLLMEPRRLWRRNLLSTPRFLWYTIKEAALDSRGRDP